MANNKKITQVTKAKAKPKEAKKKEVVQNEEAYSFSNTSELPISEKIVEQVVGQEHAVEVIKKAAKQRRHVLSNW
jgi:ATP-dependent Lon protease